MLAYYDKDQLITLAGRYRLFRGPAAELCLKLEQIRADKPQFAVPLPRCRQGVSGYPRARFRN